MNQIRSSNYIYMEQQEIWNNALRTLDPDLTFPWVMEGF